MARQKLDALRLARFLIVSPAATSLTGSISSSRRCASASRPVLIARAHSKPKGNAMSRIAVLVPGKIHERVLIRLKESFDVIEGNPSALGAEAVGKIRGVAVSGTFDAAAIDSLPSVELISSF